MAHEEPSDYEKQETHDKLTTFMREYSSKLKELLGPAEAMLLLDDATLRTSAAQHALLHLVAELVVLQSSCVLLASDLEDTELLEKAVEALTASGSRRRLAYNPETKQLVGESVAALSDSDREVLTRTIGRRFDFKQMEREAGQLYHKLLDVAVDYYREKGNQVCDLTNHSRDN